MKCKSLGEFLEQGDQNNSLISHAKFVLDLRKALVKVLPSDLARHCSIANYKSGKLVIFADNNAIAAKLKLLAAGLPKQLEGQLQQTGRQVTAVAVEVQPRAPGPVSARKTMFMSPAGAARISELCEQVSDPKLKHVLESLVSRSHK